MEENGGIFSMLVCLLLQNLTKTKIVLVKSRNVFEETASNGELLKYSEYKRKRFYLNSF